MPAVSKKQRRLMAMAEHHPEKVKKKNKGVLKMSDDQLREFSETEESGLPIRKRKRRKR